ncbi:MAG TPA: hypothetical protein VF432_07720 [Thermoanaerobaculia bacterium]
MTLRSTFIAFLLLAATLVAAQEPDTPPRFFLDAIAVEGVRYASERVIVAETRLQAGREYTEAEIRAGAARATRLPFVVRIDPRIEKGGQRGAYRLVLAVTETRPLFFGATYFGRDADPDVRQLTTGARMFLGRSGMLHGAVTTDLEDKLYEIGYTQYDLFGSGVFISAAAEYGEELEEAPHGAFTAGITDKISGQVVVGVPLRGNHALRATFLATPVVVLNDRPLDEVEIEESYVVERSTTAELSWIYDSTDDPLFTMRGTRSVLGLIRREIPYVVPGIGPGVPGEHKNDLHRVVTADVRRLWSPAPRHAVSARGGGQHLRRTIGEIGRRDVINSAFVGTSYNYAIWGPDRPSRFGDLRLEAGLVHQYTRYEYGDFFQAKVQQSFARVNLLFRNEWGLVRLGFEVEHDHE